MIIGSLIAITTALVGAGFGALLAYHLQGKAREAEHKLTIERMMIQDERAAASATNEALADLELRAFHGPDTASQLRNEWITQVRLKPY